MTPSFALRYTREEFEARWDTFLSSLQIPARDRSLYRLASIHRSVLNLNVPWYTTSNERLEFLGDAILEFITTEKLYEDFPEYPEGKMTDIRSALVRGRNLAEVARTLQISDIIQLSRGEILAQWQDNPYILANTLEAIIGALYLDLGLAYTKEFILTHIYVTLPRILEKGLYVDPKSYLQELTQAEWWQTPIYTLENESGKDHNKTYEISVSLGGIILGKGSGTSKKKWEQDSAENALSQRKEWEGSIPLPKVAR